MTQFTPNELARQIGAGLLTFPVTHFDEALAFDEAPFRDHCAHLLEHPFAALFAAGGTGEFFSLTPNEVTQVVRAAADTSRGKVPVIAGSGYGTALACEMAQAAEGAGADGILLLPPYLVQASQQGLADHIAAVCAATRLGVIVYARDNGILTPETLARLCEAHRNLVGYKDGVGDIEHFVAVRSLLGNRLTYIGGLPTAETFAPAYLEMGCTTYSSAIANFAPEFAMQFYRSVRAREHAQVAAMMQDFVLPYAAIRNSGKGYAVSIVKAGMRAVGHPAGSVRPPLTDLLSGEFAELESLIAQISDAS